MPLNYTGAIRDPIHNYIRVTDAETDLINSTFLQRLRWVSQLSESEWYSQELCIRD